MPTNILRKRNTAVSASQSGVAPDANHQIEIVIGSVTLTATVLDTPTGRRIRQALPIYSTAEKWGAAIHFETPAESGRERGARLLAKPGDICFWTERDRVIIVYGTTPISKPGEMRLPSPCNVWAHTTNDVSLLNTVVPGETVSIKAARD